jgi:hypothetical protein
MIGHVKTGFFLVSSWRVSDDGDVGDSFYSTIRCENFSFNFLFSAIP